MPLTGTAFGTVGVGDTAYPGVVTGTVPPKWTDHTIDYLREGSIWGVQLHEMRLDGAMLSGTWEFLSTDESSGGSTRLTRR